MRGPRETILFDSRVEDPAQPSLDERARSDLPPATRHPSRRHSRRAKTAAVLAPAVIAGLLGTLLAPGDGGGPASGFRPGTASAAQLARWADEPALPSDLAPLSPSLVGDLTPLAPVVQRDGKLELAVGRPVGAVTRPSPPTHIAIPDAGVSATIESVGATRSGLELPGPRRAGWWNGGPRPGEAGRSVIVGHLDTKKGPEVFARVPSLKRGAPISVQDRAGAHHLYSVVGVTRVRKARFPTDQVYGPSKRPVLVLITCGGPYDAKRGHYRDNVLVYARAV